MTEGKVFDHLFIIVITNIPFNVSHSNSIKSISSHQISKNRCYIFKIVSIHRIIHRELPAGVLIISVKAFEQSLCRSGFRPFALRFHEFNESKHALRGLKPSRNEIPLYVTPFSDIFSADKPWVINGISEEKEKKEEEEFNFEK